MSDPMREDDACFEALDRVSGELRAAEGPKLDWNRVESGLFQRIDTHDAAMHSRAGRVLAPTGLWRAFGFAAAAAAVMAIGIAAPRSDRASAPRDTTHVVDVATLDGAGPGGEHDLRALHEGDAIEAKGQDVRFGRDGVVSWTLARGGRAVIRTMGKAGVGHTIALERGSVHAEVTPRAASEGLVEAFAIEVGATRVAVHGTAFTVSREGDSVLVDVEHGSVAVGPVGHVGETSGHLLVGPSRARFSLDGGKTASWLPAGPAAIAGTPTVDVPLYPATPRADAAPSAAEPSPVEPIASPLPHAVAAAPAAPAAEPAAPAPAAAPAVRELSRGSVETQLARCFHEVYGTLGDDTNLSVTSTFRIALNADGTVKGARFDPPLRAELTTCAGGAIAGRFAPGTGDLTIPLHYGK